MNKFLAIRYGFIILLASFLYIIYRYPSIQSYADGETKFIERKVEFDESHVPAITIWKPTNIENLYNKIENECYTTKNYKDAVSCIKDSTLDLSDVVLGVIEGPEDSSVSKSLDVSNVWKPSFGIIMYGRKYTMSEGYKLSESYYSRLVLPDAENLTIEIHDPRYYVENSEKPNTGKINRIELSKGLRYSINLDVVQNEILDTKQNKCNEDKIFSYIECTKSWVSRQVGCRQEVELDPYSHQDISLCNTTEDLKKYEEKSKEIALMSSQKISKITGCYPPCQYNSYTVSDTFTRNDDEEMIQKNEIWFEIILSGSQTTIRQEILKIPSTYFFLEFIGGFGLVILFVTLLLPSFSTQQKH